MRRIIAGMVVGLLAGSGATAQPVPVGLGQLAKPNKLDQLFEHYGKLRTQTRTLSVEFELKVLDKTLGTVRKHSRGTLKLLRKEDGTILVRCDLRENAKDVSETYLIQGTDLFEYRHSDRRVFKHRLTGKEMQATLWGLGPGVLLIRAFNRLFGGEVAELPQPPWIHPALLFLSRESAERDYRASVDKQSELYVYINLLPRTPDSRQILAKSEVVVMNRGNKDIPKDALRRVWLQQPNGDETTIDIIRWRWNAEDFGEEEFRPKVEPGWEVTELASPEKTAHIDEDP